jgi:centrosomal protein CEP76
LTTLFDEGMSYLLGPALWAYEQERLTGSSSGLGNEEFQHSIKNAVPGTFLFYFILFYFSLF